VYTDWLKQSLASYPDRNVADNVELIVDGYDVVDKREYPSEDKLDASNVEGYDVVMLTGSSE
jgi:hypothetical protein